MLLSCSCVHRHPPMPTGAVEGKMLQLSENQIMFGYMPQGYLVKHILILKNHGRSSLTINDITPTCECSNIFANKHEISAGDSALLTLMFNSTSFFEVTSKSVIIKTNDPKRHTVQIDFVADMDMLGNPFLLVQPDAIVFKDEELSSSKRVVLQNITSTDLRIEVNDYFSPTLKNPTIEKEYLKPGEATSMLVALKSGINANNFSPGSITITAIAETYTRDSCRITIPVTITGSSDKPRFW